jgi:hypothetical protein
MFDLKTIWTVASSVISIGAMVASALPNKNKKGERVFETANKILNVIGFNFGFAKNEED